MSGAAVVLTIAVAAVTILGFAAARWQGADLADLEQWALGGRSFGTLLSWFLLGGDLYTAYTFIAVPALVYGVGALGFFAVPYATIAYPIALVVLAKFWTVARQRGYVTAADFVRERFGNRRLELAIAFTGVVAAMPYIALQLVGMRAVFGGFGLLSAGHAAPALTVSFVLLAAYTYTSGLRAPALIALVKDTLIYITVIAAIVVIPARLGGWAHVFGESQRLLGTRAHPGSIFLARPQYFTYATMAFGSALSLFLYPHSITSVLAARSREVIRRNAALLPIYSLLLGLIALLGYCAVSAGIAAKDASSVVPLLFVRYFPSWFAGLADAAVVIGALVPAAIMCIGAANLFASNVFREFSPQRSPVETAVAKALTLVICAFALLFVFFVPVPYAIDFQLLGGALMLQVFPAFVLGLWSDWLHPSALLAGWACGVASSCAMAYASSFTPNFTLHFFGGSLTGFIALYALAANLLVSAALTLLMRRVE
ncbi:MAG: sodium:solute symporter [Candidatus Eremiobacteraeota bacterium]|nr:sodium:solute symporter [Candidatus Eremiobacteraeota bacterium]MBV9699371.1 sodium:solute symporter [Candidatus Eremiobacteraeota bacterium]